MKSFPLNLVPTLLLLTLVGSSLPAQPASAEGIFPDENLEAVVRQYVFEKRNNDEPIVEEDVVNISTITGRSKGIEDLTGLEKCRSLALLHLPDNQIENIEAIAGLKNIQSLDLSSNRISDIKPLKDLKKLQYIQLEHNRVADLTPLKDLDNTRSLYLSDNRIEDLGPVKNLTKIWSIYLDDNKINDIGVLSHLKGVDTVSLNGNLVSDLSPLQELAISKFLFLENNKITDLGVLIDMGKKDRAESPNFSLFWQIYLTGNPLSSEAREKQLAELRKFAKKVVFKREDRDPESTSE